MHNLKLMLWSGAFLLALSGCTSKQIAQQCPQPEPMPAELEAEPQNLTPLLRELISPSKEA